MNGAERSAFSEHEERGREEVRGRERRERAGRHACAMIRDTRFNASEEALNGAERSAFSEHEERGREEVRGCERRERATSEEAERKERVSNRARDPHDKTERRALVGGVVVHAMNGAERSAFSEHEERGREEVRGRERRERATSE
eukprot:Hpha_TRINITY_DN16651_c0_g1::TRINITY_DN16651_c0_g1_i2::g.179228::m.179228